MKTTIDLQEKLLAANRRAMARSDAILAKQEALDAETEKLVNKALAQADAVYEQDKTEVLRTLGMSYKLREAEEVREIRGKWAHLPQERIFTLDAIRKVCLTYNLRFLPTEHYKGSLDAALPAKVQEFKEANGGNLPGREPALDPNTVSVYGMSFAALWSLRSVPTWAPGKFYIAAPAESFDLQPRPVDPLLFCALGNDQFYLIHKWGDDLSLWRRVSKYRQRLWALPAIAALACGIAAMAKMPSSAGPSVSAFLIFCATVASLFWAIAALVATPKYSTSETWASPYKK